MTRREERELAFTLVFERTITNDTTEEILVNALEIREEEIPEFSRALALGTQAHEAEENDLIAKHTKSWQPERLSKTAISILRLAIYEIFYEESVPVSVSINEAVELAKKYGGEQDAPFVNGVLSGVAKAKADA